jgi:hypothetical protein
MLENGNLATQSDFYCVSSMAVGHFVAWVFLRSGRKGSSSFSCWLFLSLDAAEKLHLPHRSLRFRKSASS